MATFTATGSDSSSPSEEISVSASSQTRLLLLRAVHRLYRRWAHFIVAHRWAVLVLCPLLSALCTLKVVTTPQQNDITGYTPYGARSRQELAVREHFFDSQGLGAPFGVFLLLLPWRTKGGGILLEANLSELNISANTLAEAARVDDIVRQQFPLHNRRTNRSETFAQFCRNFCQMNEPMRRFEEGFRHQVERLAANESLNQGIQLNYPVSSIFSRRFNIQPNFFGIHFRGNSPSPYISNMSKVDMLALVYKAERVGGWTDQEVKDWEMAVSRHFEGRRFNSSFLRVLSVSTTYVEVEVVRAGLSMLPFLVVGFAIMAVCTSVFVLLSASYSGQFSPHKLWLALMACVTPFMATGTALGLLFLAGVRFGSVLCVTPFLVLAIGVDDAYLMMHAWQRLGRGKQSGGSHSVADRLALVMVDTGPAILISALTNICADAVGSFTGSPEITLLCVGNMAAIAVDFLYQLTFYAAVMALVGEAEFKAEAKARFQVNIPVGWAAEEGDRQQEERDKLPTATRNNKAGRLRERSALRDRLSSLLGCYVRWVTWPPAALGLCLLWLLFLLFSAIGVSRFQVNLSTKKLFALDSPLLEIDHFREEQIVPFFMLATVFVNNPGNLSDPSRLALMDKLVHGMEQLPENWGPRSTNYFVRELAEFVGEEAAEGQLMDRLDEFLAWPENSHWRAFLRLKDGGQLESFFFTTAYHGDQLREWAERTRLLMRWRQVVDRFPELNATVFQEEGVFLDLIDNMPTDAWQSAVTTLVCMCLVCALFLGLDMHTLPVTAAVIGSIILGTLGSLSWMRTTMDPIMMAALIISIGFSVDIPAHVVYHFHSSGLDHPSGGSPLSLSDRMRVTLASVGIPAIQASLSTSLCVLALLLVPLYMAQIFVRIMFTCILLCVVHSLLLIPALFALLYWLRRPFCCSSRRQ